MFRYLAAAACAAGIAAAMAACSDRSLFPSSPTPLSLPGAGSGSSAASQAGAVGGADYHEPYPPPNPEPPPGGTPAPPAPPVFVIAPDAGPATGGTPITISGMNVLQGATVTFGTTPATDVVVVDAMSLTAMTPPSVEGAVDVIVSNPDGNSHTLAGGFTYVAALAPDMPPTITITPTGINPKAIQVAVGSQVVFVNNDVRNRTLQSDPHPIHSDCPELNTLGFIPPGASAQTAVFLTPRTCGFHEHNEPTNAALMGRIVIK